jgi:hypothetical protein
MDMRIELAGDQAVCKQDAKIAFSARLPDFLAAIVERADGWGLPEPAEPIPEGVKFIRKRGNAVVLVIEEQPQLRTVRWLAGHSPVPYGPGAKYRMARLAFPFVVLVVALKGGALTGYQQCYYRTAPLESFSDSLLYPNLYNVAAGYGQECWLCLVNLKKDLTKTTWENRVREIRKHLWGAGFNQSSEHHEGMSYWGRMKVDPRVESVDRWEAESRKDPFFPLKVEWKPVGKTVGEIAGQMLSAVAPPRFPASVEQLAGLLQGTKPSSPSSTAKLSQLIEALVVKTP